MKTLKYCATLDIVSDVVIDSRDDLLQHKGRKIFEDHCKSCHRIDQKLIGPALRGSFQKRDSIWYRKMIRNGNSLIKSGESLALQIFNEYDKLQHATFNNLNDEMLNELMEYLKLEGEESQYR